MKDNTFKKFKDKYLKINGKDYSIIDGVIIPNEKFLSNAINKLWFDSNSSGFLLFSGLFSNLILAGVSVEASKLFVNSFRKKVMDFVFQRLSREAPEIINPLNTKLEPFEFEVEGFKVNHNFQESGIDFYSTKQLHFDIVEPLSSNLYGLNHNIKGGFPVFANSKLYCIDNNLEITKIIKKIPGNRIVTIKSEHYINILKEYSCAYDVDMINDMPFSIYLNRVKEVGILHGATNPIPMNNNKDTKRPIIHYSYDNHDDKEAIAWYNMLDLSNEREIGDPSLPKPLIPNSICEKVKIKTIKIK